LTKINASHLAAMFPAPAIRMANFSASIRAGRTGGSLQANNGSSRRILDGADRESAPDLAVAVGGKKSDPGTARQACLCRARRSWIIDLRRCRSAAASVIELRGACRKLVRAKLPEIPTAFKCQMQAAETQI